MQRASSSRFSELIENVVMEMKDGNVRCALQSSGRCRTEEFRQTLESADAMVSPSAEIPLRLSLSKKNVYPYRFQGFIIGILDGRWQTSNLYFPLPMLIFCFSQNLSGFMR